MFQSLVNIEKYSAMTPFQTDLKESMNELNWKTRTARTPAS